ncbi:MAG: tetraacyldisaccharide 4-kinase [Bacteroidota bacterium]
MTALRFLLLPFSWLYGAILWCRHALYDSGVFKSERAPVITIVLGNLALGGTGKTPHSEYILKLLSSRKVAFLSRGYGRSTKGFRWVDPQGDAAEFGDEPLQVARKFRHIPVAVCEDRQNGIRQMLSRFPDLEVVVLDDAFQHRPLKGDIRILLTTWQRPFWKDILVPAGRLRDLKSRASHADAIIVTKCPDELSEDALERLNNAINPGPGQKVFFSGLQYGEPFSASPDVRLSPGSPIIGFSGIADSGLFESCLREKFDLKKFKSFGDHHHYSLSELSDLTADVRTFGTPRPYLVTTEKDFSRLSGMKEWNPAENHLFCLPVAVAFKQQKETFDSWLTERLDQIYGQHLR